MSDDQIPAGVAERVRRLADLFVTTDLMRLRIEREDGHIELGRRARHPESALQSRSELAGALEAAPVRLDVIKADLVGVFHLSRPVPAEGDLLEGDRELAYIEALGIRNPVRSLGSGRIATIKRSDGDPVEYGQVLFEIDRG
jgi:acetyl-CoA carboxylase biotin carboxyl carrier protein